MDRNITDTNLGSPTHSSPTRKRVKKPLGAREKGSARTSLELRSPGIMHKLTTSRSNQEHDIGEGGEGTPPTPLPLQLHIPLAQSHLNTSTDALPKFSPSVFTLNHHRRVDEGGYTGANDGSWGGAYWNQKQSAGGAAAGTPRYTQKPTAPTDNSDEEPVMEDYKFYAVESGLIPFESPTQLYSPLGQQTHPILRRFKSSSNLSEKDNHWNPSNNDSERSEVGNTWRTETVGWSEDDEFGSSDESDDEVVGNTIPASVWEAAPAWDVALLRGTSCQNVEWEVPHGQNQWDPSLRGAKVEPRIEWNFAPNRDKRVLSLLVWIGLMKEKLGVFGLCKFLRCKQRGALFTYADCRSERNPDLPAFEWISFDDLQQTDDNFIHASVSCYHPDQQVVIFIILPSVTGDRIAMWRRTIEISHTVQLSFDREIKLVVGKPRTLEKEEGKKKEPPGSVITLKKLPGRPRPAQEIKFYPPLGVIPSKNGVVRYRSIIYQSLFNFLHEEITSSRLGENRMSKIRTALQTASDTSASLNNLPALQLSRSYQYREQLMEICSELGIANNFFVRKALYSDEKFIFWILRQMIAAKDFGRLKLQKKDAESFADLLQTTLDKYQEEDPNFGRGARRLLVKLSEISGVIPKSLIIHGVTLLEKEAIFGGGFADIYMASYKSRDVAVKRMRVFQRGKDRHKIHRMFCKEALLWRSFRHPNVLPFLGVDSETFSPYLCMVSPWMRSGTIMRYLSNNKGVSIKKLLREVTQGLKYLHSQRVVHGDLRGSNILINDEGQACLTDFGLTVVSDATLGTHTSNSHGSVRWMAPELHDPESFGFSRFIRTFASDIYAFGCMCLEVYTARVPFADIANDSAVLLQVLRGVRPQRVSAETGRRIPEDVWFLIEWCWNQTPSDRMEIGEIVEITENWK